MHTCMLTMVKIIVKEIIKRIISMVISNIIIFMNQKIVIISKFQKKCSNSNVADSNHPVPRSKNLNLDLYAF